jgi:putative Holliday junction resolvase
MNGEGRILGVDLGERRVGFAVSDPSRFLASAHAMVEVRNPAQAANETARLGRETGAVKIVVGLPVNMDGSRGPAAEKTLAFVEVLKGKTALPVDLWDERLTTKSAHDALIEGGMRREKRKHLVDKLAAQIMLQNYLDAHGD